MKYLIAVLSAVLLLVVIGGGALNNAHLSYLRYLGKDTVLLATRQGRCYRISYQRQDW